MNSYSDNERPYFPHYLGLNLSDEEEEDATADKIRKFIGSNRSEETSRKTGLDGLLGTVKSRMEWVLSNN